MLVLSSQLARILAYLEESIYRKDLVGSGHDHTHIQRLLAMRRVVWDELHIEYPLLSPTDAEVLDLALLFHDLNRSRDMRGRHVREARELFMGTTIRREGFSEQTIIAVIDIVEMSHEKDHDEEPILLTLLRDLDKSDMGAFGILRMQGVADERGYGYFQPHDFDQTVPATEGDENLGSVVDDLRFCLEWWDNPKFAIRSSVIRNKVAHRFAFMRTFLAQLEYEARELNLI